MHLSPNVSDQSGSDSPPAAVPRYPEGILKSLWKCSYAVMAKPQKQSSGEHY